MALIIKLKEWFIKLKPYQKVLLIHVIVVILTILVLSRTGSKKISQQKISEKFGSSDFTQNTTPSFPIQATQDSVKNILTNITESNNYDVIIDSKAPYGKTEVKAIPATETSFVEEKPAHVLLYGVKDNKKTEIKEVLMDGSNDHVVVYLPIGIKDVHPVSDHGLIYIAGTDEFDHGDRVEDR